MDWLTDLLNRLTVARSFTGAIFIATAAMLALPHVANGYIDPVPAQWRWLVSGLLFFSSALLLFWGVQAVYGAAVGAWRARQVSEPLRALVAQEESLLQFMGAHLPHESMDIADVESSKISRLELIQLCKGLDELGFVAVNPYNPRLISLTDAGREKALALTRRAKA